MATSNSDSLDLTTMPLIVQPGSPVRGRADEDQGGHAGSSSDETHAVHGPIDVTDLGSIFFDNDDTTAQAFNHRPGSPQ